MENTYKNLKEKAYKVALKFNGSKLEKEIIYAKLEKQGFPENIAKEVAMNITLSEVYRNKNKALNYKKFGFITLMVWFIISMAAFFFTGDVYNVFWVLFSGVGSTFLDYAMTTSE